ncbi:hypothetical protein CABS01_01374 [Colletotrichum abscissum]|uniref:uncharacterized protein n=1 Tax=Colletotrichum abscissum TaxID=1671311 RepID=UPI0027D680AD|nr:uncharacterized protein CABS01_01374 [Colletotrichum abscissum]KAK1495567.1 hypothetical protein CABS01_01374 [Colletotrichum abscissum]
MVGNFRQRAGTARADRSMMVETLRPPATIGSLTDRAKGNPVRITDPHITAGPIPASAFFSTCAASERKTSTAPLVYHLAVYQLYTLASTTATSACPKPEIGEIIARHDDAAWVSAFWQEMK